MGSKRTALDGAVGTQAKVGRHCTGCLDVGHQYRERVGSGVSDAKNLSARKVDRDFWGQ